MTSTTSVLVRPIIGPLTTTFTPPSTCSKLFGIDSTYNPDVFVQAMTCTSIVYSHLNVTSAQIAYNPDCWPSRPIAGGLTYQSGIYSPGFICPKGYTSACSSTFTGNTMPSTSTQRNGYAFQYPLNLGETAVGCCPRYEVFPRYPNLSPVLLTKSPIGGSGYTCPSFNSPLDGCLSIAISGTFTVTSCGGMVVTISLPILRTTHQAYATTSPGLSTTTVADSTTITIPVSSTSTTTNVSSISTSGLSVFAPIIQLYHSPEALPSKSNLTTRERVVIGVTIPIVVFALVAFTVTFFLRRRKRSNPLINGPPNHDKPELEARNLPEAPADAQVSELVATDQYHELGSAHHHELGSVHYYELPAPNVAVELEGCKHRSMDDSNAK